MTHAFFFASCPAVHGYFTVFEEQRAYFRKWFGRTYLKGHPAGDKQKRHLKGFLSMVLGEQALEPDVSDRRSN